MTIYFQFGSTIIQVIPEKDLCFINIDGRPVWSGDKEDLILLLKSIHE